MTAFTPADAGFADRVRASFGRQRLMTTLGATLDAVGPGTAEIGVPYRLDLTQQHGFVHAGVIGAIADSACGYAAYTLAPLDAEVLTVEYKLNLLAPAEGIAFVARAAVVRAGRTLTVCRADVVAVPRAPATDERIVATMLGTIMVVRGRPGVNR
jgi:uncharacterized protein (TIGR00369 family)